jgi:hypothetical protein
MDLCRSRQTPQERAIVNMQVLAQEQYRIAPGEQKQITNISANLATFAASIQPLGFAVSVSCVVAFSREAEFQSYLSKWKKDRNRLSSFPGRLSEEPTYQRIIGMGPAAVPLILKQLRREMKIGEPGPWFTALFAITGENPIPEESQGKIREMADAWITWGERTGHIDAEGMGTALSKLR